MTIDSSRPHIIALDYDSQYLYVSIGYRDAINREVQPLSRITKYPHSAMHRGVVIDKQELARVTGEALRSVAQQLNYLPPVLIGIHPSSMVSKKISHTINLTETMSLRPITENDLAILESEIRDKLHQQNINSEILHLVTLQYAIDGSPLPIGTIPISNQARQLSAQALGVLVHSQHRDDCLAILHAENCDVIETAATPLVVGWQATDQRQRILGCAVLYIASETTSLCIFVNNNPVAFHTFPTGIQDVIGDIALGFQIDIATARNFLADPESGYEKGFSKKRFLDIINSRYLDLSEITTKHLMDAGWQGLLPAGVVIVPTTCPLPGLEEVIRNATQLPVRVWDGDIPTPSSGRRKQRDIGAIGAYSLSCVYARENVILFGRDKIITSMIHGLRERVKAWFQGLLPE